MPNCKHTYRQHESGFAAFCKGNPERWYPILLVALLTGVGLFMFGFFFLMWSLFA